MADVFTKEKRSEVMGRIRSKNTKIEVETKQLLRKHGIRYRSHPKIYGSPDFVLEGRLLLFCDGSVHFLPEAIDFGLLKLLAIRDSGQVKAWR